jgi:DNA-binding transcriptional LysR family regulator
MHSFDIVTLRVFLGVSRFGSIGAAARNEHIAASAASRRISDLEHDLDTILIKRTPTGVSLTPAGKVFATHCEQLLSKYANVRADLKRFSDGEAGEFRLAAITSVMNGKLPYAVARFREQNPSLTIRLQEIFSQDGVRYLREDMADFVIVSDTEKVKGFEIAPYAHDPVWVVGNTQHPIFKGRSAHKTIMFKETMDYEHLSFHEGGVLDELVAQASRQEGCTPQYNIKIMRYDSLRNCAEAGLGLGFIRQSTLLPYLKGRNLKGLPLGDNWASRELICVYPKAKALNPVISRFLECLNEFEK